MVAVSHLPDGLARARRDAATAESVPGWLRALRLEQYADVFSRSLYTEMARVRRVWEMELVTVLEVTRPGHLKRMLLSLQPPRTEAEESQTPGPDPGAEFSDLVSADRAGRDVGVLVNVLSASMMSRSVFLARRSP